MMTVKHHLLKMREILENQSSWTQGSLAKNENNNTTSYGSDQACKFCLLGAVFRASYETGLDHAIQQNTEILLDTMAREQDYPGMISFNDVSGRKHSEVLQFLDEAIKRAET